MGNRSAEVRITTFNCPKPSSCQYERKIYGCRISPYADSPACIEYHQLELLRDGFEDNVSENDMLGIVDQSGKSVFWGTFEELVERLKID